MLLRADILTWRVHLVPHKVSYVKWNAKLKLLASVLRSGAAMLW
jgi:hypothetical protein